jgi:hypothetical protein
VPIPDWDDKHIECIYAFQHFERYRSLPCGNIGIVEWMDKGQTLFSLQKPGMLIGIVKRLAMQNHFATDAFGLHNFYGRCRNRHYNSYRDPEAGAMIAEALGMVASRCRNHPVLCTQQ